MPTKAWRSFLEVGQIGTDVMVMQTPRRLLLLVLLFVWWSSSLHVSLVMARSRSRGGLDLWIDDKQVKALAGVDMDMDIPIIQGGEVISYINNIDFGDQLIIPPEMDTVNLTWKAGNREYTYAFDKFQSLDQSLLYKPLLGIPAHGKIPRYPQVFQITIPCKGTEVGVASFLLRLKIYQGGRQLKGTPIQFRLKKSCVIFATTSRCKYDCHNGGTCNNRGMCDCPKGFKGHSCETALCSPRCQNNGTCISPSRCSCLPGYHGAYCEKGRALGQALSTGALASACGRPCQNGGHCLPEGYCWCAKGFYGGACEYSPCNPRCRNGGTCIGPNHCQCMDGFTGTLCERSLAPIRKVRIVDTSTLSSSTTTSTANTKVPRPNPKIKSISRKPKTLDMKIRKTERRLLRITLRKSRKWGITVTDRRALRKLKRQADERPLSLKQRRFVIKLMTKERKHLNSKDKTKLKRFKHLIRQAKNKQKKPRKRRMFV